MWIRIRLTLRTKKKKIKRRTLSCRGRVVSRQAMMSYFFISVMQTAKVKMMLAERLTHDGCTLGTIATFFIQLPNFTHLAVEHNPPSGRLGYTSTYCGAVA